MKPLIGERKTMRDRFPFWARYRIYLYLGCALLLGIISLLIWIFTTSLKEKETWLKESIKDAWPAVLILIPVVLLAVGLAFWYRRSRRNREK